MDRPHHVNRAEWLEGRRSAIGASEVAAVLGLGAYGSPAAVWASKLGQVDPSPPSGPAAMGLDLEPYILAEAARRLDVTLVGTQEVASSPACPHLRATLDGMIVEGAQTVPIEAKFVTADGFTWGDDPALDWDALGAWLEDPDLPFPSATRAEAAYVQLNAQMLTTGASFGYLAVVLGARAGYLLRIGEPLPSSSFRLLRVPADMRLHVAICNAVPAFWRLHVETQTPPPDLAATDLDGIKRALRESRSGETIERLSMCSLAKGLDRERRRTKHHQARARAYEARIRAEMLDAEVALAGPWTITARTNARGRPVRVKRART